MLYSDRSMFDRSYRLRCNVRETPAFLPPSQIKMHSGRRNGVFIGCNREIFHMLVSALVVYYILFIVCVFFCNVLSKYCGAVR